MIHCLWTFLPSFALPCPRGAINTLLWWARVTQLPASCLSVFTGAVCRAEALWRPQPTSEEAEYRLGLTLTEDPRLPREADQTSVLVAPVVWGCPGMGALCSSPIILYSLHIYGCTHTCTYVPMHGYPDAYTVSPTKATESETMRVSHPFDGRT